MNAAEQVYEQVTSDDIRALRFRIKGQVILPGDEAYEEGRTLHNLAIDRHPAVIVRVHDAADVSRTIQFARRHGLKFAVRSGGHSFAGHSIPDGGVVIDVRDMNEIRIDADRREAWVQPGVTAGEVGLAAQEYGLAVPFGDARSVGVPGITLGGGIGFLVRKHGMTIDHLKAVELVTAEGRIIQANEHEHRDLFWAVRGGGGNFGVVTGFQFELVEVGTILGGVIVLPPTPEVLAGYAKVSHEAPEGLTTISFIMRVPPLPFVPAEAVGQVAFAVFVCYTGDDLAKGEEALAPLRALAQPFVDMVGPMPYGAIYELTDAAIVPRRESVRSIFAQDLPGGLIEDMIARMEKAPSVLDMYQLRPIGGAMSRVDPSATAFSHRDAKWLITAIGLWDERSGDGENRNWVLEAFDGMRPYAHGVYSNFLADEGQARIREAYAQATYARLEEVKARYDPDNVFQGVQNIQPARADAVAA